MFKIAMIQISGWLIILLASPVLGAEFERIEADRIAALIKDGGGSRAWKVLTIADLDGLPNIL